MSVPIKDFLTARHNRLLATVLGELERNVFRHLSLAEQTKVREVVKDAINSYHETVLDLLKSEHDVVRNDVVLAFRSVVEDVNERLLERIREEQRELSSRGV